MAARPHRADQRRAAADGPGARTRSGDEPIGEPVDLVARSTLALPDGDYRLRVTGAGRLGRTYRFAVNRGETIAHPLSLDEGRLLGEEPTPPFRHEGRDARKEPIPFAPDTAAIELTPGKADLVECTDHSRRSAATARPARSSGTPWRSRSPASPRARSSLAALVRRPIPDRPRLVEPAPDLDGDGTGDLVWTVQAMTAFLALSGKDGSVLWTYVARARRPRRRLARGSGLARTDPAGAPGRGRLIGQPAIGGRRSRRHARPDRHDLLPGVPGGGPSVDPELATRSGWLGHADPLPAGRPGDLGPIGEPLWSHPIDPAFTAIRQPALGQAGDARAGPAGRRSWRSSTARAGWASTRRPAGRDAGPIDLGFEPVRPLQYADLDGDGEPEILALGPGPDGQASSRWRRSRSRPGRPLWTATVTPPSRLPYGMRHPPDWPWWSTSTATAGPRSSSPTPARCDPTNGYRGVQMLDGSTGRTAMDPADAPRDQGRRRAGARPRGARPGSATASATW